MEVQGRKFEALLRILETNKGRIVKRLKKDFQEAQGEISETQGEIYKLEC